MKVITAGFPKILIRIANRAVPNQDSDLIELVTLIIGIQQVNRINVIHENVQHG